MKHIAVVCKVMPLYRFGVFQELSKIKEQYEFICFCDTKQIAGIKTIPWSLANTANGINWVKTSNYFYEAKTYTVLDNSYNTVCLQ